MYQTYIFDLDGTLLNTLQDLANSVNYALQDNHMPTHSLDDIRRFVGNGVRRLMERAVPGGDTNPLFDATFATFRHHYMQHSLDTTNPYEGIPEVIHALAQKGCRLAVVSNKMMTATRELVTHFFPEIKVAIGEHESAGIRKKPAPDTVYEALRQLRTLHGEAPTDDVALLTAGAVYVGDSDVDLATARNSGLPCINVLWGFRDRNFLLAHGATCLIEKPEELMLV